MRIDDPVAVARQYATETNLEARRSLYANAEGPDPREIAFDAVAEIAPKRVIEVGGGPGELAARIGSELGCEVVMLDISPRMVELARERGVDARVGDVQSLPFPDGAFDCALAAWMLFHVADVAAGLKRSPRGWTRWRSAPSRRRTGTWRTSTRVSANWPACSGPVDGSLRPRTPPVT